MRPQDIQLALRQRYRRLLSAPGPSYDQELILVVGWIRNQPALGGILAEAELAETVTGVDEWLATFNGYHGYGVSWPSETEEGRASLTWRLMQSLADSPTPGAALKSAHSVTRENNHNSAVRKFTEDALSPLFDFLDEHLGDQQSVIITLAGYVRRVEWFDREELYRHFESARRVGEEVYNLDLQKFLYLDAHYITHAKARSASGEPDLIGGLDTEDALVCDGKILDGGKKSYLAKGVNQLLQYANDYHKSVAYMVIFNISGRALEIESDGPARVWPPYVEVAGVRVYFIVVRARPPAATASQLGRLKPVILTRTEIVEPDEDAGEFEDAEPDAEPAES